MESKLHSVCRTNARKGVSKAGDRFSWKTRLGSAEKPIFDEFSAICFPGLMLELVDETGEAVYRHLLILPYDPKFQQRCLSSRSVKWREICSSL